VKSIDPTQQANIMFRSINIIALVTLAVDANAPMASARVAQIPEECTPDNFPASTYLALGSVSLPSQVR
jgi:hypothetical protein